MSMICRTKQRLVLIKAVKTIYNITITINTINILENLLTKTDKNVCFLHKIHSQNWKTPVVDVKMYIIKHWNYNAVICRLIQQTEYRIL
jgi:hypothetical protein